MLDKFSWCRLFHVRTELYGSGRAVFTSQIGPDVRLFAMSAAPDSETVSVEKESPGVPTILAVHCIWTNAKESTVSDMGARERIYAQQLIETNDSFSAAITAAPIVFLSVPDAVTVYDFPNTEAPASNIWLVSEYRSR